MPALHVASVCWMASAAATLSTKELTAALSKAVPSPRSTARNAAAEEFVTEPPRNVTAHQVTLVLTALLTTVHAKFVSMVCANMATASATSGFLARAVRQKMCAKTTACFGVFATLENACATQVSTAKSARRWCRTRPAPRIATTTVCAATVAASAWTDTLVLTAPLKLVSARRTSALERVFASSTGASANPEHPASTARLEAARNATRAKGCASKASANASLVLKDPIALRLRPAQVPLALATTTVSVFVVSVLASQATKEQTVAPSLWKPQHAPTSAASAVFAILGNAFVSMALAAPTAVSKWTPRVPNPVSLLTCLWETKWSNLPVVTASAVNVFVLLALLALLAKKPCSAPKSANPTVSVSTVPATVFLAGAAKTATCALE
mmetsp:Transcript_13162/g.25517  ORF Transcript_13162/g.25517 Transcript_13162/m.25517 type:complete len:385 (+) Transcript_13162:2269-3423(+)